MMLIKMLKTLNGERRKKEMKQEIEWTTDDQKLINCLRRRCLNVTSSPNSQWNERKTRKKTKLLRAGASFFFSSPCFPAGPRHRNISHRLPKLKPVSIFAHLLFAAWLFGWKECVSFAVVVVAVVCLQHLFDI